MGRAEGVVFALGALGEARQAPAGAQGADAVASAGEDLVRIGLVAHVPDQGVAGRGEHMVQGDGELHHAQARAQMSARLGDGVHRLGPQLVSQLAQVRHGQSAQIGGRPDGVEQGRVGHGTYKPFRTKFREV